MVYRIAQSLSWGVIGLLVLLIAGEGRASLRPELDARALASGGAWIARAEGAFAASWNPARMATVRYPQLSYDLSQGALGVAFPVPYVGVLGVHALDLHGDDQFLVQHPQNPIGRFELGYNQVLFSYARSITRDFLVGASVGSSRAPYAGSRWQINYDLGLSARISPTLTAGLRLLDIAGTRIYHRDGFLLDEFSQQIGFGLAWRRFSWFQIEGDLDAARWQLRFGAEVGRPVFKFRLGVLADLNEPRSPFHWSAGFSLRVKRLEVCYAYLDRKRHHRLSLNWYWTPPVRRRYTEQEVPFSLPEVESSSASPRNWRPSSRRRVPKEPTHSYPRTQPLPQTPPVEIAPPEILLRLEPLQDLEGRQLPSGEGPSSFLVERLAAQYRVEPELLLALVRAESNFNPRIVSKAGAVGLTQLMPDTARALGLKVPDYRNPREPIADPRRDERFHPRKNLIAGLAYLSALIDAYRGDYVLAISAYNAGPGKVTQRVPNIAETKRHVTRVMDYYTEYQTSQETYRADLRRLERLIREGQ